MLQYKNILVSRMQLSVILHRPAYYLRNHVFLSMRVWSLEYLCLRWNTIQSIVRGSRYARTVYVKVTPGILPPIYFLWRFPHFGNAVWLMVDRRWASVDKAFWVLNARSRLLTFHRPFLRCCVFNQGGRWGGGGGGVLSLIYPGRCTS